MNNKEYHILADLSIDSVIYTNLFTDNLFLSVGCPTADKKDCLKME